MCLSFRIYIQRNGLLKTASQSCDKMLCVLMFSGWFIIVCTSMEKNNKQKQFISKTGHLLLWLTLNRKD